MVRQQIAGQSSAVGSDNRELPGGAVLRGPSGVIGSHHAMDRARPEWVISLRRTNRRKADVLIENQGDSYDETARSAGRHRMATFHGIYSGSVLDNRDPENLARVLVRIPDLKEASNDVWARLGTMMAGRDSGTLFIPEVGDEVIVAFVQGDLRAPCVIGALWSNSTPPPAVGEPPASVMLIRSHSGITLRMQDDKDNKSLTVETPGGQRITLQDDPGTVRIEDTHGNSVTMSPSGMKVLAAAKVEVSAGVAEISAGLLTVHAGLSRFDGVVTCDTLISNAVVSASYTPGAGNVW